MFRGGAACEVAGSHTGELLAETDRYLSDLVDEVGESSPASVARAERLAHRVRGGEAGSSKAS